MSIWFNQITAADLDRYLSKTLVEHLGIEILEVGDDYLEARMPVDQRTIQPAGLLHGGASVALAETLGSLGASLCIDQDQKMCVGLEINASHIRPVRSGYVIGTARATHIGTSTQVWEIRIHNEQDKLACISRITLAIVAKNVPEERASKDA